MSGGGMTEIAAVPTDQITVLNAVVALLQVSVPALEGDNVCFLSMETEPFQEQRQNLYATVAPMSGRFDEGAFIGSGDAVEESGVVVTVFSQMKLDRPDADVRMLTDQTRGLLTLKQDILRALTGAMLLNDDNKSILFNEMRPVNSSHPSRVDNNIGTFSLAFSTDFYWDLSS